MENEGIVAFDNPFSRGKTNLLYTCTGLNCPLCERGYTATKKRILYGLTSWDAGGSFLTTITEEEYFRLLCLYESNYPFAFGV